MRYVSLILLTFCLTPVHLLAAPQQPAPASPTVASVRVEPTDITAEIGQELHFTAVGLDANGKPLATPVTMWFTAPWDLGSSDANGVVKPEAPGILRVGARVGDKVGYAKVTVQPLRITHLDILPVPAPLVVGSHAQLQASARNSKGDPSQDATPRWTSTDPSVVTIDDSGMLQALKPGRVSVRVEASGVTSTLDVAVVPNPVDHLSIKPATATARTGDVLHFAAEAHTAASANARDLPISWSVSGPAGAAIWPDGAFVAEQPGSYVVTANIGNRQAVASVVVTPRQIQRELEIVAHVIPDAKVPYSEEWIFGDTAYLSTIGDKLYAYDISDSSREGASTRKNGVVFLDTSDPLHPKPLAEYTQTVHRRRPQRLPRRPLRVYHRRRHRLAAYPRFRRSSLAKRGRALATRKSHRRNHAISPRHHFFPEDSCTTST